MKKRSSNTHNWWMGKVRSVDAGKKLRLVPYWERGLSPSDRIHIIIDPGPAFGAGDHPTTLMALELLEHAVAETNRPEPTMLDVGTGTGVLAIAAKALGTGLTVGLDTDPAAVFTAKRNVGLNTQGDRGGLSHIPLLITTADGIRGPFDIVAANLAAPTLLKLHSSLRSLTGGALVLSGIADAMIGEVLAVYDSGGLELVTRLEREGWHAALLGRNRPHERK